MFKNEKIRYTLIGLAALAISFSIGRFSKPAEVVTEYKTKEIIVYKERKSEKKNVTTTKRKTVNPDGSITEEESTTDRSVTDTSSEGSSVKEVANKTTTTRTSGVKVDFLVLAKDTSLNEYEFGIAVSKRVLGNISLGVIATEQRQVGLTVGLEF
jgi:hypothetical protein